MKACKIILICATAAILASCTRQKPVEEAEPTNVVAVPVGPKMFPAVLVNFSGNVISNIEERYSLGDELEIRYGPGRLYPIVPDAQALKGSKIYILEEKDSWYRFRTERSSKTSEGWINKFASIPTEAADPSVHQRDVAQLLGLGIVIQVDPEQRDATVSTNLWNIEDLTVQKGIGHSLAFYCAQVKGRSTHWVDIRDSDNGRKIARYSENLGFSSYVQSGPGSGPK